MDYKILNCKSIINWTEQINLKVKLFKKDRKSKTAKVNRSFKGNIFREIIAYLLTWFQRTGKK